MPRHRATPPVRIADVLPPRRPQGPFANTLSRDLTSYVPGTYLVAVAWSQTLAAFRGDIDAWRDITIATDFDQP
ncbi:hypothetical protein GA0070620_1603 [Micromonospora krabiensis]|uniref:Uncharacterized protein n=1 Tax=Micromonospora krabiensis TaxID=307121 RepID=A0A1C3N0P0_9ACTN|nr:hypothetical protein GA0070620_1603 [Micromonospora krabiensis]